MFQDENGKPYAVITIGDVKRSWPIRSKQFTGWLNARYRAINDELPSSTTLQTIQAALEAEITLNRPMLPLNNRVAKHDNASWYDLGEKAVRIDENGWSIQDAPPVLFRRSSQNLPQVEPCSLGDISKVLPYVNLKDKNQVLLFLVMLVSCFIPNIPHPVIAIHGSKGAGKTCMQRILSRIIDPSKSLPSTMPTDENNLILQLSKSYLTTFDNMQHIKGPQSDLLCQVVTGGSAEKRQLYTDDNMLITNFRGIACVNGINLVASRADLLERCIILELQRIDPSKRITEDAMWSKLEADLPVILGGIFTTLSKAMKILPTLVLTDLPRMADFASYGCAIAVALGYTKEDFLTAYHENITLGNEQAVNSNPLAEAVRIFMGQWPKNLWAGTVGELYGALDGIAGRERLEMGSRWPKGSNVLKGRLKEVEFDLQEFGIIVHDKGRSNKGAMIEIVKRSDDGDDGDDLQVQIST